MRVPVPAVDDRRVDSGDDVGVRDHEARTDDPSGALDPEPARKPPDPHDGAACRTDVRIQCDRRIGRIDPCGRTDDRGERVDSLHGVHHALRRQRLGQRRDHDRLLREPAELGLAGQVEEHGADRPADREARRRSEGEASGGVQHAERRHDRKRPPRRPPDERAERLAEHAPDRRAGERDEGDVRAAVPDEARGEPRSGDRPDQEPDEREDADDESAPEAADHGEDDDHDRDPVGGVHPSSLPTPSAVTPRNHAAATILRRSGA